MKFAELSSNLEKLENTPKRLEITSILSDLIDRLEPEEADLGIYLSLGYLRAQYNTLKFGMADKMVIKAIQKVKPHITDLPERYARLGDLGLVILEVYDTSVKDENLTISQVHQSLSEIANIDGPGSQDAKINGLATLINKIDPLSAKYVVRIVLGTTRLGFTELTIVDALSHYLTGNKTLKKSIEEKYFVHPDIGSIVKHIKRSGIAGLKQIGLETGIPVLAQKAQRLGNIEEILNKLGACWAEYKFDGTRVQLHFDKRKKIKYDSRQTGLFEHGKENGYLIRTFTRNLEDSTHQHPDIIVAAKKQVLAESAILDGEAIGYDIKTGEFLPFQEIMQRKRKHSVKEMAAEIPLKYFVFDLLYLNGNPLIGRSLRERHTLLNKIISPGKLISVAEKKEIRNVDDLEEYFNDAKKLNLEGLIVKKPDDFYQAGARSFSWVKLKRADERLLDDSLDVVVLGYYHGKGDRSKFGIGKFLAGVYDNETGTYKTLTKVGTGLKDEDLEYLKRNADKLKIDKIPSNVVISKEYMPDIILNPKLMVEIGGDEISVSKTHSSGYALRFPRLLYFRTDKSISEATTLKEIIEIHALQKRGRYRQ